MKWIRVMSTVAALLAAGGTANAGLLSGMMGGDSCKSCDCTEDCAPECCKPIIVRPCGTTVHTYQRKCSTLKPPVCGECCPEESCAPCDDSCAPTCGAPSTGCCLLGLGGGSVCDKGDSCAPACDAPCEPVCEETCAPTCGAPSTGCCLLGGGSACDKGDSCAPACDAPCAPACETPCDTTCEETCCETADCCDEDPCELAKLIYTSMTACYADDREDAIHEIGDNYSCICHPEIMHAFIYALNDADEDVREKAADEIGDQIREHGCCCCTKEVVAALTQALADCDDDVVDQAEEALEACGYEICDAVCDGCTEGCDSCNASAAAPIESYEAPAMEKTNDKVDVPPAPPAPGKTTRKAPRSRNSLANLFGLAN